MDYRALFAATPSPYLVLDTKLVIVDVNEAYQSATGRTRQDLMGLHIFEAFPDNPDDPDADGVRNLNASLQRVLAHGVRDSMALQKYDIPVTAGVPATTDIPGTSPDGRPRRAPDVFEERWWSPINAPVPGEDGSLSLIIHRVEDVTEFVRARADAAGATSAESRDTQAELFGRARELQRLNEELRLAHAREREVALTLQQSMLPVAPVGRDDLAVRYLPAVRSLNVCGDWYDVVALTGDRLAVAVGDVVGHGLAAAGVMGQLRSALSAAVRAADGPARALEVLAEHSRTVDGALATSAALTVVDRAAHTLTYSSAGHPPPVLLHPDGTASLLDAATDPPLDARVVHAPQLQACVPYVPGDTLVLYTDGLVERRDEDIDVGLARLTGSLARHTGLAPDRLADSVLADLGLSRGGTDDIALVIVRL
ncbi:PP2C family protein-serine/threonine phosphatase [Streptomyces sp. NPDC087440]|uniref:PP2C family protein-serine/threonine phosphatase n=1 Tax=Streptomyces sp. NPDC087440 TaxID=3365790 RepID=UPI00382BF2E4